MSLPSFEYVLKQRGRRWLWSVHNAEGAQVMTGSGRNRSAAIYQANRALFQLLLRAPYRLGAQASNRLGAVRLRPNFSLA
ncbi:hypothetical protein GGD62_005785 [Bradyrhizobium sp. ERR14]|nr:hypothetical protein [Bradyrhizobium sp. ERR14]